MFIFDQSIETGNQIIDSEHRQLIDAINRLLESCVRGDAASQSEKAIQFLNQYVHLHFSHEEQLQLQYGYPDYARHKMLHEGYKKVVADLTTEYSKQGPSPTMLNKLNTNIGGWLITHIKREDKALAAYIQKKG
ncbi:MAG: hemerythrin family protein [Lawsonibacter sp.]|nr:hemerythrin family protein [Lawsonibacter sp.]